MERPSVVDMTGLTFLSTNVVLMGDAKVFAVRSTSNPDRAYIVSRFIDSADLWGCSCPADHIRLGGEGRYCSTIEKVRKALNG